MTRKLLNILILMLVSFQMQGQVVFNSIEDVWKYADGHNVTIRTAEFEVKKSNYATKQSIGSLLPQASLGGTFTDNTALPTTLIPGLIFGGPAGSYKAVQFGQKFIYQGSITAQMDIINLQNWFNVKINKQTEDLNKASLANTKQNIYQEVAKQYYSYFLMDKAALLAEKSRSIADSVYQSVNNKFKQGTVNAANVDQSKINLKKAEQTYITALYQLQTTKNTLKGLLGMSVTDSLIVNSTLIENIIVDDNLPFKENPFTRISLYQKNISLSQYRASNSSFLPTVSIAYSNSTQQNDSTYRPFKGGPQWYPAAFWQVKASFPIFTGGSRVFQSEKYKVAYNESKMQYENALKQEAINDENIRLTYRRSVALLQNNEEVMNLSFDNYMHLTYRYEVGAASLDERLTAFSDYINYQNQYLNSLSDMLVQLYQIKIRQQSF